MSSRDPRTWMWAEACDLLSQADRLHRQFFRLAGRGQPYAPQAQWEPPYDMVEFPGGVLITVALPGARAKDIRVAVSAETGAVVISAERLGPASLPPASLRGQRAVIRRLEIPYGHFERHISLPVGRYQLQQQAFVDGCLELHFAKF